MTHMIHDRCGMTLTRILRLVLSITALQGFVSDAVANIILNPGFENGSGADAADWAKNLGSPSGSVRRSSGSPASGDFAAHMAFDHIVNPAAGGAYFIEQNQGANSVNTTLKYDLRFVAKADSTDFTGTNMFYQLLWLDQDASHGGGGKGETLTSLTSLGLNTSYQPFSHLDINVPSGADSFLLRFQVAAGAVAGVANGMWVDNVSLTAVPEPASWCLLSAVGFLSLAHRRRKGSIRNPLVTTGETC